MPLCFGKTPARKDSIKLKLADYLSPSITFPAKYNHSAVETSGWQLLGNDKYGDCVEAGAGHETMLWCAETKKDVTIMEENTLSDYAAITGFNPADSSTDQGTDMQVAASYRKNTGIIDTHGVRHKVAAYVAIAIGNKNEFKTAMSTLGLVGLGLQLPNSAVTQFNANKPWTVEKNKSIAGGHYVPIVGYDTKHVFLISWGKLVTASWEFILKYADEAVAYLSEEMLTDGKTIDGFNLAQLQTDIKALETE